MFLGLCLCLYLQGAGGLGGWLAGWVAGWLAGSMIIVPILAPSCKLKLARFSAELRIQDGAECGNIRENTNTLRVWVTFQG